MTIKLEETLTCLNQTDVDSLNDEIVDAVRRSAEEVCPPIEEMKKKEPWEDEELIQLVREMKKC